MTKSLRIRGSRLLEMCPQIAVEGEADNGLVALNQIEELQPVLSSWIFKCPERLGLKFYEASPPMCTGFMWSLLPGSLNMHWLPLKSM